VVGSTWDVLGLYTICSTTPREPLITPTLVHKFEVSITLAPREISNSCPFFSHLLP
jgi:hypothetical protein